MSSLAQLIELSEVCVSALSYLQRTAFQLLIQDDLQLFAAQYFAKVHLNIYKLSGNFMGRNCVNLTSIKRDADFQ